MIVYLSASYSRKEEMKWIRADLEYIGIMVISRWIDNETESSRLNAETDVRDVETANVFIRFSDDLSQEMVPSSLATGSRMFEMGLAWSLGIPIFVVGGYQCVFDYLPAINHVKDTYELKKELIEWMTFQGSLRPVQPGT